MLTKLISICIKFEGIIMPIRSKAFLELKLLIKIKIVTHLHMLYN